MFWVGILLLISAGSFLYVATIHILPEVFGSNGDHHDHSHTHERQHKHGFEPKQQGKKFGKWVELLTIMAGLAIPMLLMLLHDDD